MTQGMDSPTCARSSRPTTAMVVVGDDGTLARQIEQAVDGLASRPVIERLPSFMHALGSVGTGSAPTAVIGRLSDLHGSPEATAHAFARLAPQTQLVVVASRQQAGEAGAALHAGFHRWWVDPVDTAAILSLQSVIAPSHEPTNGPTAEHATDPVSQRVSAGMAANHDANTGARADTDAGDTDPAMLFSPAEGAMIETMLRHRQDVAQAAVAQLRQHPDLASLGFAATADDVPPRRTATPITYGERQYGLLHASPRVSQARLATAAHWMGRWMALGAQIDELWDMALRDPLTKVWNRRYFDRFLNVILQRAAAERFAVTLLLFDIDDFKVYNDRYGHGAGDEILRETARFMQEMVRPHDVVARIGGDEFAVIFWESEAKRRPDSQHPQDVNKATRRFRAAIGAHKFPKLADKAPGTLTISGGLASFPWDGRDGEQLLERADEMALESKRQGKNVITFGPGALQMYAHNGVTADGRHCDADHDGHTPLTNPTPIERERDAPADPRTTAESQAPSKPSDGPPTNG